MNINILMLKYGDIFSGIGCPAFALKQLGIPFSYEFACDVDKKCIRFLEDNHQPNIIYDDVRKIKQLPYVDLLVMGFPCQPFSYANHYVSTDEHKSKDMWEYCITAINLSKPKMFIMENVASLTHKHKKEYFDKVIEGLNGLNEYHYSYQVLNSLNYGIPQSRPRLWILGKKKDDPIFFPKPRDLLFTLPEILDLSVPMNTVKPGSCHDPSSLKWNIDDMYVYTYDHNLNRRFRKFPTDYCNCILTGVYQIIYKQTKNGIISRPFTNCELKKLFGCTTDIIGDYSNAEYHKFFGNGMDIHLLEMLISVNIH